MGSGEEGQGREGRDARVDGGPAVAELRPGNADGGPSHDHIFLFRFFLCFLVFFFTVVSPSGGCGARRVIGPEQPNKG